MKTAFASESSSVRKLKFSKLAKNFAIKRYLRFYPLFTLVHTLDVVDLCKKLAESKEVNMDLLLTSAWLHDIGRIENEEKHHEVGARIAEKLLKSWGADKSFIEGVKHCIREHGTKGMPRSEEAKILREADGVSVFHPWLVLLYLVFLGKGRAKEILRKALRKVKSKRARELLEKRIWFAKLLGLI